MIGLLFPACVFCDVSKLLCGFIGAKVQHRKDTIRNAGLTYYLLHENYIQFDL